MPEEENISPRCAVLVVEDNPYIRRALARLLELEGYRVQSAETVAGALYKLDGQIAVLLDLDLPDGPGTLLLKHIDEAHNHLRVAVVSGSTEERLAEARRLNADLVMQKPLDVQKLLDWLATLAPK